MALWSNPQMLRLIQQISQNVGADHFSHTLVENPLVSTSHTPLRAGPSPNCKLTNIFDHVVPIVLSSIADIHI